MGKKKLDLIIGAIAEAKEVTRKGHPVKVYMSGDNGLKAIYPQELKVILLKLQDDEKIIRIKSFPNWLLPSVKFTMDVFDSRMLAIRDPSLKHFVVDILDGFDKWYGDYQAKTKSSIEKLLPMLNEKVISPPEVEITHCITFTPAREILLNNSYQIAKPDFDSENDLVFDYLYKHPNEKFTKEQIEAELRIKLAKSPHKIIENLGFTGVLRKAFFSVSKNSIQFRNPVKSKDLAASVVAQLNSLIAKA